MRAFQELDVTLPIATIDALAFGGNGVCRIDGKVYFVPYSCPGDEVALRITHQKKSYGTASISEIKYSSMFRTAPSCPIFGLCGGCSWQHIDYSTQLQQKQKILEDTLCRVGGVAVSVVQDATVASLPYGYRSRIRFKVSCRKGSLKIGFYRHGSHLVEDAVCGCPVAVPEINEVLHDLRIMLQAYPDVESVTQLSVDAGDNGVVVVLHQRRPLTAGNRRFFAEWEKQSGNCAGFFVQTESEPQCEKIWGCSTVEYALSQGCPEQKPLVLTYSPGGFAQVNRRQNQAMVSFVGQLGAFKGGESLLDLYCGNGNFSLPLADRVSAVVGIEGNPDSVLAAEYNKVLNGVANASYYCDDVVSGIGRLAGQGAHFDVVIIDPPRAGAGDAVPYITSLRPNKIIYVSCDPSTLARDCALLSAGGYRVVSSIPFDMFPQTYHIESVTLLVKEKGIK